MDLTKVREQVDLMDIKAVELCKGLDRLICGLVVNVPTDADGNVPVNQELIPLTTEQKAALQAQSLRLYTEIKGFISNIDAELAG